MEGGCPGQVNSHQTASLPPTDRSWQGHRWKPLVSSKYELHCRPQQADEQEMEVSRDVHFDLLGNQ